MMRAHRHPRRWLMAAAALGAAVLLGACATAPSGQAPGAAAPGAAPGGDRPAGRDGAPEGSWPQAQGQVLGRNERLLVYRPAPGDSFEGIAARFLGASSQAWQIVDANDDDDEGDEAGATSADGSRRGSAARHPDQPSPALPLIVPLQALNPLGVSDQRLQTVPILCYHRLGAPHGKMVVAPAAFEAQMAWLVRNGYRVIAMADLGRFLAGRQALPARAVVVTFDDGYESVYRHAFPVLKKYRLPATLFVYTDFVGGGEALTWAQLQEMHASGLIDVQSHSKSHRNLVERRTGETEALYRANLEAEMRVPRELLERRLAPLKVTQLAYPFGDADATVLEAAAHDGIQLGATVVPGGNAFYARPLMLRRTMIFGDLSLEGFKLKLQTSRALAAP